MNVENLSVNVPEGYDATKPIEIVLREGTAPEVKARPKALVLALAIASIWEYVSKRTIPSPVTANPGIIVFSRKPEAAFIKYMENPMDKEAAILEANLKANPDFQAFGINEGRQFSQKELQKHIRKYAHCFATPEQAKQLIQDLQNFEVRYEQTVAKEDNRQGQTKDLVESAIKFAKGEIPRELHLKVPFFEHTPAVSFTVEVEIDKGPGNLPVFSFYSLEVELHKRQMVDSVIDEQLDKFREAFPVLEQQ